MIKPVFSYKMITLYGDRSNNRNLTGVIVYSRETSLQSIGYGRGEEGGGSSTGMEASVSLFQFPGV